MELCVESIYTKTLRLEIREGQELVAAIKVATLSKHAFETPREAPYIVNLIRISGDATSSSAPVPSLLAGRPDKDVYDAEQERIKDEINLLQVKLVRFISHLYYL
jgi:hypothetical protein